MARRYQSLFATVVLAAAVLLGCSPPTYFLLCNATMDPIEVFDGRTTSRLARGETARLCPPVDGICDFRVRVRDRDVAYLVRGKVTPAKFSFRRGANVFLPLQIQPDLTVHLTGSMGKSICFGLPTQPLGFPLQPLEVQRATPGAKKHDPLE